MTTIARPRPTRKKRLREQNRGVSRIKDVIVTVAPGLIPISIQRHLAATSNGNINKLHAEDRAAHEWYRFVLSFPPQLVRHYVEKFNLGRGSLILDPFCGTGTTIVECKKLGIESVGVEANPMAHFASRVKVDWSVDPVALAAAANRIAGVANRLLAKLGIDDTAPSGTIRGKLFELPEESHKLMLTNSISPLPLHKVLVLKKLIRGVSDTKIREHMLLALARVAVSSASNLHFGPEVGVGKIKEDAEVIAPWQSAVNAMAGDIRGLGRGGAKSRVINCDSRELLQVIQSASIDAVITSPPYPNEKDYSRTTRLESVLLGFINSKEELRAFKKTLVRSNTRSVYKSDDDDRRIAENHENHRIEDNIEVKRILLGKTGEFERMYARVTKVYFGGMARHLADLRRVLKPGARLAYVVGDQASFLRIMIRTGRLLAEIADSLGYEVESIDLFRTRLATATREQLREEIVVLRWPGYGRGDL